MSDVVHYKNNFLTEVIVRVDWLEPVDSLSKKLPKNLSQKAKKSFPIAEPSKKKIQEVQITPDGVESTQTEITEWNFHDKDRTKTLTVTTNALFVKYTTYESFEVLKRDFSDVLTAFFSEFKDIQVSRLGLRYVNNITLDEQQPLRWEEYIDDKLLSLFSFYQQESFLARVFHILELNFGDSHLRYQFGIHNPDYPATIRRKVFVLDLDAYYPGLQEKDDVLPNLDKFHGKIQELFEMSIKDGLRRKMS